MATTYINTTEFTVPKRCAHPDCKKKLRLTDCDCRCGQRFCSSHRLAEDHNCTYNYKAAALAQLEAQLVKVTADRMERI